MSFCPRCGTKVAGAFCGRCGAPTPGVQAKLEPSPAPDVGAHLPSLTATTDAARAGEAPGRPGPLETDVVLPQGVARRSLAWETRFVMASFLVPSVISAVLVLAQHISGVVDFTRFPRIIAEHPLANMWLGILAYLPVAAVVPLALFLLNRTGQHPSTLGLGLPCAKRDGLAGLGLAAAAFATEVAILIPFAPLIAHHQSLVTTVSSQHVPAYYVVWGITISAVTAITEEVIINGYLLTRLHQLGWMPRASLVLSLALRTSYHVYYGLGFILTVPFGYYVTRSFQKHHRLNRPIAAHFIYDAVLITVSILR